MNGDDLRRRVGQQRAEARMLSKLSIVERRRRDVPSATAADCARIAKDPERRLEALKRRTE